MDRWAQAWFCLLASRIGLPPDELRTIASRGRQSRTGSQRRRRANRAEPGPPWGPRLAIDDARKALSCARLKPLTLAATPLPAALTGAFGLTPGELTRRALPPSTFGRLHRPWAWRAGRPALGARVQEALAEVGLELPSLLESATATDGATKALFGFGVDRVEAVHMPRAVSSGRVTLCVSSQVGCAMGCSFCATASMGLRRQLDASEIVTQVLSMVHAFGPRHPGELTLVFMGMGEPLHNLAEVARAIALFAEPSGLGLSPKRITVSTSGLVPQIDALAKLTRRPLLALSLNATTDAIRRELMPIARRYSLADLHAALCRYPLRPRERITIEYVLLAGVNDSDADAARLADFCEGFAHHINLIPFNSHPAAHYRAPSEARLNAFARALLARRPSVVSVRRSRGRDIRAACGQLAHESANPGEGAAREHSLPSANL